MTTAVRTPFFSIPPDRPSVGRLLLLSHDFPPGQTAGALRWQKLAHHALENGWALDVVTLDPSSLRAADESRLADLPPGVRIYGVPGERLAIERVEQLTWELYRRLRPRRRPPAPPEGGLAIGAGRSQGRPESFGHDEIGQGRWEARDLVRAYYAAVLLARDGRWARRAGDLAARILRPGLHRAVVTCGPPHMVHLAGQRLSRASGLPFIMDMRDPWSQVERLPEVVASPLWLRRVERLERRAIADASLVVANTDSARLSLQKLYPGAADRCITVMNGYDEDPLPPPRDTGRFVVAYAGTIYLDRDPRPLFRAAAQVVRERGLEPRQFGIELMGSVQSYDGLTIDDLARQEGLEGFVRVHPPAPREAAMRFLAEAAMLVSLPQDSHMAIPSKVFEYMRFDAWLLALAKAGSATELLLRGSGADVVAPDDVAGIAAVLRERYRLYQSAGRPPSPVLDARWSRGEQARRLFAAIEPLLASRPRPVAVPSV